jgi:adenylate kinase
LIYGQVAHEQGCAQEIDSIRNSNDEYTPERNAEYAETKLKELEKIVIDQHYITEKE